LRRNGRADHGELRSRTDPDHAGGPRRGNDQNSGGAGDPGGQSAHGRSHLEGRRRGPDQLRRTVGLGIGPDPDDSLPADLIPAAASLVSDARSGSDGAWIGAGGQARASIDDPQPSQDLAKIDGPPDPDALGRKQAVVLRIPHALVPVSPIPTDWNSRPSLFRFVARALFWMSHNGAPKTADRMLLISLALRGACMISSRVLQALPRDRPMLPSPLARRRKARHYDAAIATRAVRYSARDLLSQRRLLEPLAHRHAGCRARRRRAQGAALPDRSGASRRANE